MLITRSVPSHDPSLVEHCSIEDLLLIEKEIVDAIGVGAPLYNSGNHEACFRIYEGTALALKERMGSTAERVVGALLDGIENAATAPDYSAKAWAMRDAFDGVLDVIEARLRGLGQVERQIPAHDISVLEGCSDAELEQIAFAIGRAISAGAPLYNQGLSEACFAIYRDTALELTRRLPQCAGPAAALRAGVHRAEAEDTPEAQAWAMRDTFDALLLVIKKRALN